MFFNEILKFNGILNWLPNILVVIKPGKSIWWTPRTKAHRKLGLFSKPFSCQSRCFHHGWPWLGDPGYLKLRKSPVNVMGIVLFAFDEIWYVILSWWNLYNHSDWLFLASKTFMKQWCKVRLQPCGFVWCSVWSYQWITWSAGLIGGGCSFQIERHVHAPEMVWLSVFLGWEIEQLKIKSAYLAVWISVENGG